MLALRRRCPQLVGPAPQVLKSIRAEMKERGLGASDRRMPTVSASLVAEPIRVYGWNEGIFYPPTDLPTTAARLAPSLAVRDRPTTGKLRCLVLLVDFTDNKGKRDHVEFEQMLFSQGNYPTGSMYDFYKENSYEQLDLEGEVVGWLRLPRPYAEYVNGNNGGGSYPDNAQKMVEDALPLAVKELKKNGKTFKDFDGDKDGFLDGLFIIHAGGGAEADPDAASRAKKIWSHQWNLPKSFENDNIKAYAYCTEPEDGKVGVFCHEFGHMLGLPDLYDTTNKTEGVGVWCVMGAGSWNNGGLTPGHFCAWSKMRLGWITPTVVRKAQTLEIPAVEKTGRAVYRLWTKGKLGDEYFLIENRQLMGFDAKLPGSGLLVLQIDDSQHNNDHPGNYWVAIKQADGKNELELGRNRGDKGDLYPGSSGNKKFDAKTNPAATDRLGDATEVAITAIAEADDVIKCKVAV
jgi:immune inhibitor A